MRSEQEDAMRAHAPAPRIGRTACAAFCLAGIFVTQPSQAAEYGLGTYLLGLTIPAAGFTPPPGVYFSDTMYFYQGDAGANVSLPFGRAIGIGLREQFLVNIATLSVFTDASFLGGTFGLAGTVPVGRAKVSADLAFVGPLGTVNRSDSVTGIGDSAITAILGWHAGFHHWNVSATGVIPTGVYSPDQLAIMGLNRPGGDVKGAYTYLNTQTGTEVSGAAGVTFNWANTATDYLTGTELHLEGAVIQHLPSGFSFGVGGYHYRQVTGDSGTGAVLGPFLGRVTAVGPVLGYVLKAGAIPINLNARWFAEFDTQNRVQGHAVFATLSLPLHAFAPPPGPPKFTK
jgi:hypothetical protein